MKPRVILTRSMPAPVMRRLNTLFDLKVNPRDRPMSPSELVRGVRGRDALISMLSDRVTAEVIAAGDRLRVIANYAAGYNNIDLPAAAARGIVVTNTPGVLTEATADLAWALILGTARRVIEGDRLARSGTWTGWAPTQMLGMELQSKILGIVGMGRIGQAVARRAAGFGMRTIYHSRHRLPVRSERRLRASFRPLRALLRSADIISLHLPLTPRTRHLIGRSQLNSMKPAALLINTARGPVVDEKALVAALRAGTIAGAGLDVFEREPEIEKGLRTLPNTVLLPHLGSATDETRIRMGWMVIENIRAVLSGRPAPHQVTDLWTGMK